MTVFIDIVMWLLFGRVILGLFASDESKVMQFCYAVTEPVLYPMRSLLSKIPALEDFPIDLSYMATYLVLIFIKIALPYS